MLSAELAVERPQLGGWDPPAEALEPGEALPLDELRRIAADLAGQPALWRDAVRHDSESRAATLLHRSPNLDVWLLCWLEVQETGLHDHDRSSGAVHVCEGELVEDVLSADAPGSLRVVEHERRAGTTFAFGGSHIHGVRHAGTRPATSIHVYSPALLSMGHYEVGESGGLERIVRFYEQGISG